MVSVPSTSQVTDTGFDAAKAAGGTLVGASLGNQFLVGNIGAGVGAVAGALATGNGTTNKAAATVAMMTILPNLLGGNLSLGGGSSGSGAGAI